MSVQFIPLDAGSRDRHMRIRNDPSVVLNICRCALAELRQLTLLDYLEELAAMVIEPIRIYPFFRYCFLGCVVLLSFCL